MKSVDDRHRILECPICKKKIRSLKRHKLTKPKNFYFQVINTVKSNIKDRGNPSNQAFESEIVANGKLIDEKIALSEKIPKVRNDGVKFYPWQQQTMNLIQKPTYREVIWVKGTRGN